jgi:RimJ/RimL family protein N-acetyltransferase
MFPELTRDDVFRIETSRLWLRWARVSDAADILHVMGEKTVAEMTASWPYPLSEGEVNRRIFEMRKFNALGNGLQLVMALKSEPDEIIGLVGGQFLPNGVFNIGYALDADFQGVGYGTEAVQASMDAVFTLSDASQVTASIRILNEASRRVLIKCGFQANGIGLEDMPARGGKTPSNRYCLTRQSWNALNGWEIPIAGRLMIDVGIDALEANECVEAGMLANKTILNSNIHV